eukprot:676785_1
MTMDKQKRNSLKMQRRLYRQKVQGYGTNSHMIQDQLSNLKTNLSQTRVELSAARAQMEQHLKYDTHTTTPGLPSLSGATSNAIALAPPGMVFNTYGQFCAGPAPYTAIRTGARRTNSAKRNSASSSKKKGTIPTSGTNKDRFKFIFSRVNSVQSPFKKRIQIMKQSVTILEDEKSDDLSAKDTVEPHKKCLTIQPKHTKQSKSQTAFYWKYLMQYLENACSIRHWTNNWIYFVLFLVVYRQKVQGYGTNSAKICFIRAIYTTRSSAKRCDEQSKTEWCGIGGGREAVSFFLSVFVRFLQCLLLFCWLVCSVC